ncbi:MAG TPA: rRNA adenine N(6)-methyltransferase family protein [Chloroflexota bacterium]|nr:rRNA adenine N(6)-methyltransferase family protein [Chloroflexota bacterium]
MLNSPRHSVAYAQNFLHSPRLVDHLLDRSSIGPDDRVLEIGPGKGIITAALARRCREVLAVEKDPDLAHLLRARFALSPAVTIREDDFLGTRLPLPPYKVFANVPFNCTAEIIRRLTETRHPPDDIYLAVQQEAAERFLGRPRESLRSVLLKPWFEPSLAYRFRQADFVPAPQVEVVMLRLRKRGPPLIQASRAQLYRDLVIHLFTAWKPSLCAALTGILSHRQIATLDQRLGLALDRPPTALPFEQWLALFAYIDGVAPQRARQCVRGSEERLSGQQARLHKAHRTRQRSPRLSPDRTPLTGSASGLHGVRSAGGAAPRRC